MLRMQFALHRDHAGLFGRCASLGGSTGERAGSSTPSWRETMAAKKKAAKKKTAKKGGRKAAKKKSAKKRR
jgi:hypothetical protein